MPSKIATSKPLTDAQARSQAEGSARVIMSLAGRTRHLWEMYTGTSAVSGEEPATAPNPQGLIGYDLSGPPWGSAPLHSTAYQVGMTPVASDWQAPGNAGQLVAGTLDLNNPLVIPIPYWCRPYEVLPNHESAYSRQYPTLRMYLSSATTADVTVRCCIDSRADPEALSDTFTVTGTTETTYTPACHFRPRPGPQMLFLDLSSDDASVTVTVASWSIAHRAKRTY